MSIAKDALAIGLTGPFGSGCTTCSKDLRDRLGFTRVPMSGVLRREWAAGQSTEPERRDLQDFGNEMRKQNDNPGILAEIAIRDLEDATEEHVQVAFDGIRNVGEIEALRRRFGFRFFLFAIECSPSDRWQRLEPQYRDRNRTQKDFADDDKRDRNEDDPYGQQVIPCMDKADVLINNDDLVTPRELRAKLINYVKLVSGESPRYATQKEKLMNAAYSSAHSSKCLKRQVGAVVVDDRGLILSVGFNENPTGTLPCVETPAYRVDPSRDGTPGQCYRDIVRYESYIQQAEQHRLCPNCGDSLQQPTSKVPPWRCPCGANLDDFFWPERAMSLCTAVHAEVAAIHLAGRRARGAAMFTTTFPCFQCAEQIIHAGISAIIFTEPYPDLRAADRLELAGIKFERFEGVRSWRFHEIFARARPYAETFQ